MTGKQVGQCQACRRDLRPLTCCWGCGKLVCNHCEGNHQPCQRELRLLA